MKCADCGTRECGLLCHTDEEAVLCYQCYANRKVAAAFERAASHFDQREFVYRQGFMRLRTLAESEGSVSFADVEHIWRETDAATKQERE
jgi:hypothetical protein